MKLDNSSLALFARDPSRYDLKVEGGILKATAGTGKIHLATDQILELGTRIDGVARLVLSTINHQVLKKKSVASSLLSYIPFYGKKQLPESLKKILRSWCEAAPADEKAKRVAAVIAIKHCCETSSAELDLSALNLTQVPPVLDKLSHLKRVLIGEAPHALYLKYNLTYVQKVIGKFQSYDCGELSSAPKMDNIEQWMKPNPFEKMEFLQKIIEGSLFILSPGEKECLSTFLDASSGVLDESELKSLEISYLSDLDGMIKNPLAVMGVTPEDVKNLAELLGRFSDKDQSAAIEDLKVYLKGRKDFQTFANALGELQNPSAPTSADKTAVPVDTLQKVEAKGVLLRASTIESMKKSDFTVKPLIDCLKDPGAKITANGITLSSGEKIFFDDIMTDPRFELLGLDKEKMEVIKQELMIAEQAVYQDTLDTLKSIVPMTPAVAKKNYEAPSVLCLKYKRELVAKICAKIEISDLVSQNFDKWAENDPKTKMAFIEEFIAGDLVPNPEQAEWIETFLESCFGALDRSDLKSLEISFFHDLDKMLETPQAIMGWTPQNVEKLVQLLAVLSQKSKNDALEEITEHLRGHEAFFTNLYRLYHHDSEVLLSIPEAFYREYMPSISKNKEANASMQANALSNFQKAFYQLLLNQRRQTEDINILKFEKNPALSLTKALKENNLKLVDEKRVSIASFVGPINKTRIDDQIKADFLRGDDLYLSVIPPLELEAIPVGGYTTPLMSEIVERNIKRIEETIKSKTNDPNILNQILFLITQAEIAVHITDLFETLVPLQGQLVVPLSRSWVLDMSGDQIVLRTKNVFPFKPSIVDSRFVSAVEIESEYHFKGIDAGSVTIRQHLIENASSYKGLKTFWDVIELSDVNCNSLHRTNELI